MGSVGHTGMDFTVMPIRVKGALLNMSTITVCRAHGMVEQTVLNNFLNKRERDHYGNSDRQIHRALQRLY